MINLFVEFGFQPLNISKITLFKVILEMLKQKFGSFFCFNISKKTLFKVIIEMLKQNKVILSLKC